LHQHEEIQLSCIVKGEGTFFVGDRFGQFSPGDVFGIGAHLPHVFSNESTAEGVHMISLFFTADSYGRDFFEHPEFHSFNVFFEAVRLGFRLDSDAFGMGQRLSKMLHQAPLDRFLSFVELIDLVSKSDLETLSSDLHRKRFSETEGKRMRDIMDYTLENYARVLSVGKVAEIANMSPNAFCRYFRQRTNKTYMNFVTDLRIGQACRLLTRNRDLRISEIAFQSGFNNLTHFNRKFKQVKGMTPSRFRVRLK
jgi:AraC-like DNA-binding protein